MTDAIERSPRRAALHDSLFRRAVFSLTKGLGSVDRHSGATCFQYSTVDLIQQLFCREFAQLADFISVNSWYD